MFGGDRSCEYDSGRTWAEGVERALYLTGGLSSAPGAKPLPRVAFDQGHAEKPGLRDHPWSCRISVENEFRAMSRRTSDRLATAYDTSHHPTSNHFA